MQIPMEVTGSLFAGGLVMYPGDLTFLHQSELGMAHFTVEMKDPKYLLVSKQIPPYSGTDKDYTPFPVTNNTHIWKTMSGQVSSQ